MATYLRWGTGKWGALWGREPGKLLLAGGGRVSFSVSTHTSTNVRIQAGGTTQAVVRKSIGIPVVLRSGASLATTGTYTDSITANMVLFGGARFALTVSKATTTDVAIRNGPVLVTVGSAREHLEGLSRLSGGARFTSSPSKHMAMDIPIAAGVTFRYTGSAREHLTSLLLVQGGGSFSTLGTVLERLTGEAHLSGGGVFTPRVSKHMQDVFSSACGASLEARTTKHMSFHISVRLGGAYIYLQARKDVFAELVSVVGGSFTVSVSKHPEAYLLWGRGLWGQLWGPTPYVSVWASGGTLYFEGSPAEAILGKATFLGGTRFAIESLKHTSQGMRVRSGGSYLVVPTKVIRVAAHLRWLPDLSFYVSKHLDGMLVLLTGGVHLESDGSALEHLYADMSLMGGGRLFGTVVKSAFAPFELLGQTVFIAPGRMLWVRGSFPTSDWKKGDSDSSQWIVFYPNLSDWRDKK